MSVYANLFHPGESTPFASILAEREGVAFSADDPDTVLSLIEQAVIDPTLDRGRMLTFADGEDFVRAVPFAMRDPFIRVEVVDTDLVENAYDASDDEFDPDDPDREIFHTPGGKPHNQKNHTRHGYIRKNPKLGNNVDAKILKKDTVSAGASNYTKTQKAKVQEKIDYYKGLAAGASNPGDKSYYQGMADVHASNKEVVGKQGKATLGKSYYSEQGKGKLVAIGSHGTWGVVEIESPPFKNPEGKGIARAGKKVIVDFEKIGVENAKPSKGGKSIGSERNKKEALAIKKQSDLDKKIEKTKAAGGDVTSLTDQKNKAKFKKLGATEHESAEWKDHWKKNFVDKLTDTERQAIGSYTGSGSSSINKSLRNPPPDEYNRQRADNVSAAIRKGGGAPRDMVVFRGDDWTPNAKLNVGDTFQDLGFTSTSVQKKSAFSGSVEYEIRVPKGTRGAYVKSISTVPHENEFLLDRGTKYRIIEKTSSTSGYYGYQKTKLIVEAYNDD